MQISYQQLREFLANYEAELMWEMAQDDDNFKLFVSIMTDLKKDEFDGYSGDELVKILDGFGLSLENVFDPEQTH